MSFPAVEKLSEINVTYFNIYKTINYFLSVLCHFQINNNQTENFNIFIQTDLNSNLYNIHINQGIVNFLYVHVL